MVFGSRRGHPSHPEAMATLVQEAHCNRPSAAGRATETPTHDSDDLSWLLTSTYVKVVASAHAQSPLHSAPGGSHALNNNGPTTQWKWKDESWLVVCSVQVLIHELKTRILPLNQCRYPI